LKERYEVHHGVRIKDSAIVAAATLSDATLPTAFYPTKAIDLIDEAAASLRIQIDSDANRDRSAGAPGHAARDRKAGLKKEDDPTRVSVLPFSRRNSPNPRTVERAESQLEGKKKTSSPASASSRNGSSS